MGMFAMTIKLCQSLVILRTRCLNVCRWSLSVLSMAFPCALAGSCVTSEVVCSPMGMLTCDLSRARSRLNPRSRVLATRSSLWNSWLLRDIHNLEQNKQRNIPLLFLSQLHSLHCASLTHSGHGGSNLVDLMIHIKI